MNSNDFLLAFVWSLADPGGLEAGDLEVRDRALDGSEFEEECRPASFRTSGAFVEEEKLSLI